MINKLGWESLPFLRKQRKKKSCLYQKIILKCSCKVFSLKLSNSRALYPGFKKNLHKGEQKCPFPIYP